MSIPAIIRRLVPHPLAAAVLRSAWTMRWRLAAVVSIAAFGLSVYVGTMSAIDSLFNSRDHWYAEGDLADLELRFVSDDDFNVPDLSHVPGVAGLQKRMIYPGTLGLSDDRRLSMLWISTRDGGAAINGLTVLEGRALEPGDTDGVLIDRNLARYQGVRVGDSIEVKLGNEQFRVTVRGVAASPEFLLAPANPSLFVPTKGSMGVLFARPEALDKRFGFPLVNSIAFRLAEGADVETVRSEVIEAAQKRLSVDWTIARNEQFSFRFLEKDLAVFRIVVPVIAASCTITSAVVTVFLFLQWVVRERQMIGVLMALGYAEWRIAAVFLTICTGLAIPAIFGGLAFSVIVLGGFAINFAESVGLPQPLLAINPSYVLIGGAAVLAIFLAAGLTVVRRLLKLSPRDAMRQPGATATRLGRRELDLTAKLDGLALRFAARNVLRTRTVSALTAFAVALGFGVTTSFFISFSSFVGTATRSLDLHHWDLAVDFLAPVWQEDWRTFQAIPGVKRVVPYTKGVVQAISGAERHNLYVGGIDPAEPMQMRRMVSGRDLAATDSNAVVLEKSIADTLKLKPGDTMVIEARGQRHDVRVVGLHSGALPGEAYMPVAFHRGIADLSERATGMFITVSGDRDAVAAALYRQTDVQNVLSRAQIAGEILQASGQVTDIINMGAMVSVTVALLFVVACITYSILQRVGEYGVLRLLGYTDRRIAMIVIVEVCLLGCVAIVLAVPVGWLVAEYLNSRISEAWFRVETVLTAADYLGILIPGFLLMPLTAAPNIRLILRYPLSDLLKERKIA